MGHHHRIMTHETLPTWMDSIDKQKSLGSRPAIGCGKQGLDLYLIELVVQHGKDH
jgi:hypothetical protein